MYISPFEGYKFLVVVRCNLSGWVEAKLLRTLISQAVADFLWENIICHHISFEKLFIDERSENKDLVVELDEKYGVKRIVVSACHLQGNGMIERRYEPIADAFSKISVGESTN